MLNAQDLSYACDALLKDIWKRSHGKTDIFSNLEQSLERSLY